MPTAAERAFAATVGEMATRAQYEVLRAGRDKLAKSAPLWRRVTDGKPCGFCAMVASRGPVYTSESAAGANGNRYHARCGCTAEPYFGDPNDWEPSPEERRFMEAYTSVYRTGMPTDELSDAIEAWLAKHGADVAEEVAQQFAGGIMESLAGANPGWATGEVAYRYNCPSAVTAYELRMRGQGVVARAASEADVARGGQDVDGFLARWLKPDGSPLEWRDLEQTRGLRGTEDLVRSWDDGHRGFIIVQWKRDGGHIFAVHNDGGRVRYLDPQSGEEWDDSLFKRVAARKAFAVRSDDLIPSDRARELIE